MPIQTNITGLGTNEFGLSQFGENGGITTYGTTAGGNNLSAMERSWFQVRNPGATAQTPLSELKKLYWEKQLGSSYVNAGMQTLETEWLRHLITQNGGTPSSNYNGDLWRQLLSTLGVVPSKYLNENKMKFYIYQTI